MIHQAIYENVLTYEGETSMHEKPHNQESENCRRKYISTLLFFTCATTISFTQTFSHSMIQEEIQHI